MACISSINFAILVNVCPTEFFQGYRRFRQGFLLSPLLFLVIIEGLKRLILRYKSNMKIKCVKISYHISITHMLFVEDAMICGDGHLAEWRARYSSLRLFCNTTWMLINAIKSIILKNNIQKEHLEEISVVLPYKTMEFFKIISI